MGGIRPRNGDRPAPCPGATECRGRLVRPARGPARGPASVFRPAAPRPPPASEVGRAAIIGRAAGLDGHQGSVVARVIIGAPARRPARATRTFATRPRDPAALREWRLGMGVAHVGLESTGV